MKKTRKYFAILCILLTILHIPAALISAAETGTATAPGAPLQFHEDGSFTILQLADIQTWYPMMRSDKPFLKDAVTTVQPDLIVLTGDQLWGNSIQPHIYNKLALKSVMDIFEELGYPVALVFGNHDARQSDQECKEMMMEVCKSYSCFIGSEGEIIGTRVGNYNLPILSSDGSKTAFNLWFIDSGSDNDENDLGGYACVTKDQINWYINTSNSLKEANGGALVPSINFQHIIVPEIFDALVETPEEGFGWALPEDAIGTLGETPCPPNYSNGQFDAFVKQGDVIATVHGHDHVNSFVVEHQGIDIINTAGCTFSTYNGDNLGYRVIELDEANPWEYETYTETYLNFYKNNEKMLLVWDAYSDTVNFGTQFLAWIRLNPDFALYNALAAAILIGGVIILRRKKRSKKN